VPTLYELGIPVVQTDDKWHVNIQQKVPLNSDRDNVTPAYLRDVRVSVFNHMHQHITEEDTEATWINEATSDETCTDEAAETFRVKKYGEKSVASDPFNREADAEAHAHGYTVIPGRGLTRGQRENLKRAGTLRSSTQEFPTAGVGAYSDSPEAQPVDVVPEERWSKGMRLIREYTIGLGQRLLGKDVHVRFVNCRYFLGKRWGACYGRGHVLALGEGVFDYNLFVLGRKWSDRGVTPEVDQLIIHEFGHDFASNHLCEDYHQGLCCLGATLKAEALKDPDWFRKFVKGD
jgi:hypothetical protein